MIFNMGGGGGISIKKVWENASPKTEFAAQTIRLDLSDADEVAIEFTRVSVNERVGRQYLAIGEDGAYTDLRTAASGVNYLFQRNYTTTASGVEFNEGLSVALGTNGRTQDNTICIPRRIYAIKGVT